MNPYAPQGRDSPFSQKDYRLPVKRVPRDNDGHTVNLLNVLWRQNFIGVA
jgi:hypothetical protein